MKKAFDKIADGLREALSVARGEAKPAKWSDQMLSKVLKTTRRNRAIEFAAQVAKDNELLRRLQVKG